MRNVALAALLVALSAAKCEEPAASSAEAKPEKGIDPIAIGQHFKDRTFYMQDDRPNPPICYAVCVWSISAIATDAMFAVVPCASAHGVIHARITKDGVTAP